MEICQKEDIQIEYEQKKQLKIIIVTMNTKGGILHYTAQLSNALSLNGEVTVIAPLGTDGKLFNKKVKLITLPLGNTIKNFVINTLIVTRLINFFKVIKREKPAVIHFQSSHFWMALITILLKKCGYVIITTLHDIKAHVGVRQFDTIIAENIQLKYSDCIIVHGKMIERKITKELKKQGLKKEVRVIPHGDYSFFTNYAKNNVEETNSILFFGNIVEYKGLKYLIEAEPLITEKIPDARIIIAGEGELKKYHNLIENANKFKIHNEFIPDEEVPTFFQKAKVIVLPYIEGTQSGIIPIAYAFKKPVVVTNVGCMPEVVDDGVTGFIVPPRDVNALANAIIKLLKDDELRKQMGENAYKKMKEELSWDKIAEKTIEVYEKAIRNKACK